MSSKLSRDQQYILGVVQELRDSEESFLENFSSINTFLSAFEALYLLRVRYPEFKPSEIEFLTVELEQEVYNLICRDKQLQGKIAV